MKQQELVHKYWKWIGNLVYEERWDILDKANKIIRGEKTTMTTRCKGFWHRDRHKCITFEGLWKEFSICSKCGYATVKTFSDVFGHQTSEGEISHDYLLENAKELADETTLHKIVQIINNFSKVHISKLEKEKKKPMSCNKCGKKSELSNAKADCDCLCHATHFPFMFLNLDEEPKCEWKKMEKKQQ